MKRLLKRLPFSASGGSSAAYVLGVMVASRALHAVLLRREEEGVHVVRRFSRQRGGDYGGIDAAGIGGEVPAAFPDVEDESEGEDFTIQFGGGTGGGNLFLGSEFGDLGGASEAVGGASGAASWNFVLELEDILDECRDAGYEDVVLAFCLAEADTEQLELLFPEEDKGSDDRPAHTPVTISRKKLLGRLADQHEGPVEAERVAFLPMTPTSERVPRYLALVGQPAGPVLSTLNMIREEKDRRMPSARLLDTETSLYLGLARGVLRRREAALDGTVVPGALVVRAGEKDTLVLFVKGETLHHSECLHSLTAYDAPETICSRVLLLQDEYGIGEVDSVLLAGGELEDELIESFEMFFPGARVEALREHLPEPASDAYAGAAASAVVPAAGVALRLTGRASYDDAFEEVNLLPKALLGPRLQLSVGWYVPALYAVMFLATFFFVARYFDMEHKIADTQRELERYAAPASASPAALQASIDSMQSVYQGYVRGLEALDGALRGSDRWSRALEEITQATAAVEGVWVESWRPADGEVELSGTAVQRDRIVRLAERTGGRLRQVTFSEIRDWPVYSFQLAVPLASDLPAAVQYLRRQVAAAEADPSRAAQPPASEAALQEE